MNPSFSSRTPRRRLALAAGLIALLLTAGCAVGPDYHAPATAVKMKTWDSTPAPSATTPASPIPDAWWTTFDDPELGKLVTQALASSPDITIATERVHEARAGFRAVSGREYPTVGVGASRMEYRRTGPLNTINPGAYGTFQAGFDASWEIDLWGGTRRAVESAAAALQATEEDSRGVRLVLAAEVARTYVDLRATQRRLAIARTNLALQEHTLALTQERLHAGVSSHLDVLRARELVANTQAFLPLLEDGADQLTHRLAILLGEDPDALLAELTTSSPIPAAPAQVAAGLPVDLLRHRPDILAAERRLAAATARIGAAKAELYPHLTLVGSFGFVNTQSAHLFDLQNRYFGVGPGLHWNLFDAGRIRAQVDAESARTAQAYAQYKKTVLAALADVDDTLGAYHAEQRRHAALVDAVDSARQSVATATELYRQGVTDFLGVIDAERSLAAAEDNLAQSDRAVSTNLIALYKSLGGGWQPVATESSHQS